MSKRTLTVALLALIAVLCLAMVACMPAHEHEYETNWSYDETQHWHKCKGCDEVADKAAHHGGTATCSAKAICVDCGQTYGELADHDWGEWKVTTEPTCTEKGVETRVCKVDPTHTETREVAAKDHNYADTWSHDETNHWIECTACNDKKDLAAHQYGDWTVVTEASYTAAGSQKHSCTTCGYEQTEEIAQLVAVTSVTIDGESTLQLKIGDNATLTAKVLPDNATDKTLTWTSTDSEVVEVVDGEIIARSAGTATITATAHDGQGAKASVTITVVVLANEVKIVGDSYVAIGGTIDFAATVSPDNTTDKTVSWSTDNNLIATIDNSGKLTAVAEGKVTVTATTTNGKTATATVYVTKVAIDGNIDDELYSNTIPLHNDTLKYKEAVATNPITDEIRVIFGDSGLYVTHKVTDAFVGAKTCIETFICTGDTPVAASGSQPANMYYVRFYVHPENGKFFTNVYNGKSGSFPWNTDVPMDLFHKLKITENGFNVEIFIPYSTIGLTEKPQTINLLSQHLTYATANAEKERNAVGNYYGIEQAKLVDINNYWKFDSMGYYRANNTSYGIINSIGDITVGNNEIVDGNYVKTFTVNSTFQEYNSLTAVSGLSFDNEYITAIGNGVYKISIPKSVEAEYYTGKEVAVKRGNEVIGSFKLTIVEGIPVTSISLEGGKTQLVKDEETTFNVVYNPANANLLKGITWHSSDENVATVVDGKVTAVGYGYATITAVTEGGVEAKVTVWVPETVIDGNVDDELYANTIPLHNDTLKYGANPATNVVRNETKMIFGDTGLYIAYKVTDGIVGKLTRIETFICTGNTKIAQTADQLTNLFYFRFYVNRANGEKFTNVYNGTETTSNTYPWTEVALNLYYEVKLTEQGYNMEVYIPYSTIGLTEKPQTINYLSMNMMYDKENGTCKGSFGNSYGLAQKNFYDLANFVKFDQMGYYRANNTSFGIINSVGDILVGINGVVDGKYVREITIQSKFHFQNSFTAVSGLTFDSAYITEVGNGVYRIAVPEDKQPDFATAQTIKIMRGTEEIGTFTLRLTTDIPVEEIEINGPDIAFVGDKDVKFTAKVFPENATNQDVEWTSSNTDVATIDSQGNVTIVGIGTTTITAAIGDIRVTQTLVVGEALTREAVVKVTYENGTVVNSGTNSAIEVDTVIREKLNESSAGKTDTFTHTDKNKFVNGIDGDANGALSTNNEKGSYLLIKGYNLGTNDFTISTWVYISDFKKLTKDNGKSQIFGMSNPDNNPIKGITLCIKRNNSNADKATGGQVLYKTPSVSGNQVINTKLNCNGWHKYTVTREGTAVKVYFDNTLLATANIAENADLGANDICFGAYIGWQYSYNNGSLVYDNVTIYDYALTQGQIVALTASKK